MCIGQRWIIWQILNFFLSSDAADSVKSEKSQIPPGGAESSSQTVPPGMGPADLQMMNMWNSFMKKHRYVYAFSVFSTCDFES